MHAVICCSRLAPLAGDGGQVVVNYASSAGAAEDVAQEIKASGGDAIVVGADLSSQADIERCSQPAA